MKTNSGQIFHVPAEPPNQTLAAALRAWLPDRSWTQVQQLIRKRHVTVNGNLCLDAGRRLKPKEVVKLLDQAAAPVPREEDVRVRHVDQHVVVVEKPAGVTSNRHPSEEGWKNRRKQVQPTLDELLPRVLAKLAKPPKPNKNRPRREKTKGRITLPPVRPVHRLDRETSGLMVFARTVPAERHLGEQFRKHSIERRYLAVVQGRLAAQTVTSALVRDRGDGRRGGAKAGEEGKRAVTHVTPLEELGDYTLVECQLETGRTHQIRIHLAELGHPLCGEKVYHQPLFGQPRPDKSGAPRIALHAATLGFEHPGTGQTMRFQMPLPNDLAQFIERLRTQAKTP